MKCRSVRKNNKQTESIPGKALQEKASRTSRNGYALHQALLVLLLMGQLCALLCVMILQAGSLRQAAFQSEKDLRIIQEARKMAEDVLWERRCLEEQETFERMVTVPSGILEMEDHQTFLLLTLREENRKISLRFYYDETGYCRLEYVRKSDLQKKTEPDLSQSRTD